MGSITAAMLAVGHTSEKFLDVMKNGPFFNDALGELPPPVFYYDYQSEYISSFLFSLKYIVTSLHSNFTVIR